MGSQYSYVAGRPTVWVDPSGMEACTASEVCRLPGPGGYGFSNSLQDALNRAMGHWTAERALLASQAALTAGAIYDVVIGPGPRLGESEYVNRPADSQVLTASDPFDSLNEFARSYEPDPVHGQFRNPPPGGPFRTAVALVLAISQVLQFLPGGDADVQGTGCPQNGPCVGPGH